MQHFITYDASGKIRMIGIVQDEDFDKQSAPGLTFMVDDGTTEQETSYVFAGAVTPRPACPVGASVSGLTISLTGVPLNAVIRVMSDDQYTVTNDDPTGNVALVLPDPGAYNVSVDCFPAQDFSQDFTL